MHGCIIIFIFTTATTSTTVRNFLISLCFHLLIKSLILLFYDDFCAVRL